MSARTRLIIAVALFLLAPPVPFVAGARAEESASADTAQVAREKTATASASAPKRVRERTIAPFPVPGDSSALSVMRWRMLNLPQSGMTTVAPLPPPGTKSQPSGTGATMNWSVDSLLQRRIEKHQLDCDDEYTALPEAIHRVDPVVPRGTTAGELKRIIKVFAVVNERGLVEAAQTREPASTLDSAAVACVRQWRFKPAMHCGHALPVWVGVPIRFDSR